MYSWESRRSLESPSSAMRRDGVTASSRKYSSSPCRASRNIGFDERTEIRMYGERFFLLALTIARKKVFVSSTVSRPNNSARRTSRSRVILYPMALRPTAYGLLMMDCHRDDLVRPD